MQSKKLLYIVNTTIDSYRGVSKKILFQYKALKNIMATELCYYFNEDEIFGRKILGNEEKELYKLTQKNIILKFVNKIRKNYDYDKIFDYIIKKNIKVVYMRYLAEANYKLISFFSKLKKNDIKIILEIPTYPYDLEYKKGNIINRIKLYQDILYRKNLEKYVDKIVTFSEDKEIWNISCINIANGIDLEEITLINKKKKDSINFVSISTCFFWHGIDRFLYSLLQYRKNGGMEKVKFHIVGEGSETPKLRKIVEDNIELQDIVIFHGFKSGVELDKIYNYSDIALGSLGIHRLKLESVQPLKNREYCAKGLPFVIGFNDPNFKNKEYVYEVSYDDELIDIKRLIQWYKNLEISPEEIRKDAKEFTWDIQMKKVLDNI